jgi:hypothetical protein
VTLEERIDRIFNTGEIELAGEAYKGKYELGDGKSMKKFIYKMLIIKKKRIETYLGRNQGDLTASTNKYTKNSTDAQVENYSKLD